MKGKTIILYGLIVGLFLVLLPAVALAGGLFLSEISGPEVGLASAGWAARAQNASTLFTNPAGMTRFSKDELEMGLQPIYLNMKFSADSDATVSGKDGDASGWMPAGGTYLVHSFTPDFKMGLGVLGYFGLVLDFNDNWVGKYSAQYEKLQGMSIMPAAAYKVNDWLSIGGSMNFMYGMFETEMALNNIQEKNGSLELKDNEWGIGYTLGIMVEPTKRTRFGLTYLSKVKLDFKTNPKVGGPDTEIKRLLDRIQSIDLGMTVPQSVMGSFYHEFNDQWALMGNLGWQQWSRFGKIDFDVEAVRAGKSGTTDLPYKDTWHGALGLQFKPTNPWLLSFGISYDSSCIDDKDRSLILPVGESWKFGTGARYRVKENLDLTMAYEFAWGGDMPVKDVVRPMGTVSGQYDNAYLHFINLGLTWKF